MKRIAIDTNVVIAFLTDRDSRQQEIAARLFEDTAAAKRQIVLHQPVITEVIYVLQNLYKQATACALAIPAGGSPRIWHTTPSPDLKSEVGIHTIMV